MRGGVCCGGGSGADEEDAGVFAAALCGMDFDFFGGGEGIW